MISRYLVVSLTHSSCQFACKKLCLKILDPPIISEKDDNQFFKFLCGLTMHCGELDCGELTNMLADTEHAHSRYVSVTFSLQSHSRPRYGYRLMPCTLTSVANRQPICRMAHDDNDDRIICQLVLTM